MATLKNARRLALAGGFALTMAAAPAVAAFTVPSAGQATPVAACAEDQTLNPDTGECMGGVQDQPGAISESSPGDANSLPEVQGVPCTGANTGECIGLQEEQQAPAVEPHSTLEGSQ